MNPELQAIFEKRRIKIKESEPPESDAKCDFTGKNVQPLDSNNNNQSSTDTVFCEKSSSFVSESPRKQPAKPARPKKPLKTNIYATYGGKSSLARRESPLSKFTSPNNSIKRTNCKPVPAKRPNNIKQFFENSNIDHACSTAPKPFRIAKPSESVKSVIPSPRRSLSSGNTSFAQTVDKVVDIDLSVEIPAYKSLPSDTSNLIKLYYDDAKALTTDSLSPCADLRLLKRDGSNKSTDSGFSTYAEASCAVSHRNSGAGSESSLEFSADTSVSPANDEEWCDYEGERSTLTKSSTKVQRALRLQKMSSVVRRNTRPGSKLSRSKKMLSPASSDSNKAKQASSDSDSSWENDSSSDEGKSPPRNLSQSNIPLVSSSRNTNVTSSVLPTVSNKKPNVSPLCLPPHRPLQRVAGGHVTPTSSTRSPVTLDTEAFVPPPRKSPVKTPSVIKYAEICLPPPTVSNNLAAKLKDVEVSQSPPPVLPRTAVSHSVNNHSPTPPRPPKSKPVSLPRKSNDDNSSPPPAPPSRNFTPPVRSHDNPNRPSNKQTTQCTNLSRTKMLHRHSSSDLPDPLSDVSLLSDSSTDSRRSLNARKDLKRQAVIFSQPPQNTPQSDNSHGNSAHDQQPVYEDSNLSDDEGFDYIDPMYDIESLPERVHSVSSTTHISNSSHDANSDEEDDLDEDCRDDYLVLLENDFSSSADPPDDILSTEVPAADEDDEDCSGSGEGRPSSRFMDEPLYQIYHAGVIERQAWNAPEDFTSDADQLIADTIYEEAVNVQPVDNKLSHTSSTLKDQGSHRGVRTLWCEMQEVQSSGLLESLSPDEKKLQESLFEIITSEASYLRSIDLIITTFMHAPELKTTTETGAPILTNHERHVLFSNITTVQEVSQSFLAALERKWSSNLRLDTTLCNVIHEFAQSSFQVYVKYCGNQVYQERKLKQLRAKNSAFREAIWILEHRAICQGLSFLSFLTLPMQRITRLPLLVDSVCRHVNPSDTTNYQRVLDCLSAIQQLVKECNEAARQMENLESISVVERNLAFKSIKKIPLISSSRYLLKQGLLTRVFSDRSGSKIFKKRKETVCLFLFSDLVIVTKKKSEANFTVIDYAYRVAVQANYINDENVRRWLPNGVPANLHNLFVLVLLENHEKKLNEFLLSCKSESEMTRWMEAMNPTTTSTDNETIYETWDCPQVQAIHQYTANQPDELSLEVSDTINVTRKMADGWYEGERIRDGLKGWFPANYTVEVQSAHVRAKNLRQRYRLLMLTEGRLQNAKGQK